MSHHLIMLIAMCVLAAFGVVVTAVMLVMRRYVHGIIFAAVGCGAAVYWVTGGVGVAGLVWLCTWAAIIAVLTKVGPSDEAMTRFVRESYVETRYKSAWPTWPELRSFTLVVIFALFVVSIWIGGLDFILGQLTRHLGQ